MKDFVESWVPFILLAHNILSDGAGMVKLYDGMQACL